ncbi:MAG TPA: sialate O-acetylesterase [Tepidisphaeraceae bacterium]|nr:sialate O-acetylesterase [Tepidisphaeraceae bacterium]
MRLFLLIALLVALPAHAAGAPPKFAGVFTDHAVLQRDRPIPVWGTAAPGEPVVVSFAGQHVQGVADNTGRWSVKLAPLAASTTGRPLIVSGQSNRGARIEDVLVGEVWLCSGQSNMAFRLAKAAGVAEEIAAADDSLVRFFSVEEQFELRDNAPDVKGRWTPVSPKTAAQCSAVAYYFGRDLRKALGDVPVGLLVSSVGGTRIETWMRPELLAADPANAALIAKWKDVSPEQFEKVVADYRAFQRARDVEHPAEVAKAKSANRPPPPAPTAPTLRGHDCPSALHRGMIAPLVPYAIRGACWYQGESNSGAPERYEKLQPAMIADWRALWADDKLPFLFVQLPSYKRTRPDFRQAQARIARRVPSTAMVVTLDVGDANDIHPTNKRPVGQRLALAARAVAYGEKVSHTGPTFAGMTADGGRATLTFANTGGGLVARGDEVKGFEVAGPDGKFVPASAKVDGDTVTVTAAGAARITAVRYGWATVPDGNLFGKDGLPAGPFRTDEGK